MQASAQAVTGVEGRTEPHVDFQVSRNDASLWTIEPLSDIAKAVAAVGFGLGDPVPGGLAVVASHSGSNALLRSLRSRGFSILYHGPAGPIRL